MHRNNFVPSCIEWKSYKMFQANKQRDPISPCLFILCIEILSRMLTKGDSEGRFHGVRLVRTSLTITHLMFGDDIMIFLQANMVEGRELW